MAFSQLPVDKIASVVTAVEHPMQPADYTGHYVLLAARAESSTVTGSVHVCDGGVGVRGRKQLDAAIAAAFSDGGTD
jgi:2,3-dihydroxy-2,3-dihydrophenylpropionate dehydrogenase/cis-2,3-dihydrobiphenyl-2,3-diol dehydrogenase